ncbi:MAG TPA: glycoside hydrolase domain-containing protein [Candidatus Sulfotelmatobacter sp.]|nr:glycoside hydrolase domain-containing protein [Candidatus Sulfotelmatobacter sp.]
MIFSGFDSAGYPGDANMRSIWDNTELRWCGFYLGPGSDWNPHFPQIQDIGWGVAPIYTGKQPGSSHKLQAIHNRNAADPKALKTALWDNGVLDGQEAVDQARASHIPLNTILYFDVEDTTLDPDWLEYYRGWSRGVVDRYYGVGLYTRREHAAWLMGKLMGDGLSKPFDICMPTIWIARYNRANANGSDIPATDFLGDPLPAPDPKTVYSDAAMWQHIGNFGLKWTDSAGKTRKFAPVDFDTSIYPDPGTGFLSAI